MEVINHGLRGRPLKAPLLILGHRLSRFSSAIFGFILSVTKFNPNYHRTGKTEILNKKMPRLAPFTGDMKFASQISPLLNLILDHPMFLYSMALYGHNIFTKFRV